mgnify:CR=1 FL=1
MEYIYSALLLHKAGKKVDEASVKAVLSAAGISPDEGRIKALVAALDGVNIDEAIASASIPVAAPAVSQSEGAAAPAKEEKKKDEGKSTEEASAGLAGLFG